MQNGNLEDFLNKLLMQVFILYKQQAISCIGYAILLVPELRIDMSGLQL